MTPQVLRKRTTLIASIAVGVILLIILVPLLSIMILIGLLLPSSNDGTIWIFIIAFIVLIPLMAIYLLLRSKRKVPDDHPFNFIYLTDRGLLIRRSVLNNDIPTENFIPYYNIQSITKDYRWYIDKQAKIDGVGKNIFKRGKWVPKGALWIGLAPKDYHILIKLNRSQNITTMTYDRKTKYPSLRVDLTDVIVISVRPEQQKDFLEMVGKNIRSPTSSDDDQRDFGHEKIDSIGISQNVILREFGTSLERRDTFIPPLRIYGSLLLFFTIIILFFSFLINFFGEPDYGDTADKLVDSMCVACIAITLIFVIITISSLISVLTTYNIRKLRKENKVIVGSIYLEILTRQGIGNSLRFMNRFPRTDIRMVRPVTESDLKKWKLKGFNIKLLGIMNATNIGLHHFFVQRENLLLLKLDREVRLYHDHIKVKWYQNRLGEMWSDEVIIDIPKERHDEFIDLVFS
jgi:hypothetical protein